MWLLHCPENLRCCAAHDALSYGLVHRLWQLKCPLVVFFCTGSFVVFFSLSKLNRFATVAGGQLNTANGFGATVAGGRGNKAFEL